MRRFVVLLASVLCVVVGGSGVRAGEEPFAFPSMDDAQRIQQRHLKMLMMGKSAGGVSGRVGYLPDGRMLTELRMAMQITREDEGRADVFRVASHTLELLASDGRTIATKSTDTEADVVETSEAVYGEKHVDLTFTGPGGTYRKRLEIPADHASSYQIDRALAAAWKPGTEPKRTYSRLSAKDQRFEKQTTTLLGKTTYVHDTVAYPAWHFRMVDDEETTMQGIVGEDFLPFEMSGLNGAMKAFWVNEPTLESDGDGWSMSSFVPVDRAISGMLKLESLELRLVLDAPQDASETALLTEGPYQSVAREAAGYRVTLKSQRVPNEAATLTLPMKVPELAVSRFLGPTPDAQSDHAEIVAQAKTIAAGISDPATLTRRVVGWVWAHIEKESGARGSATALEVLQSRKGDCSEHAVLVVALCRAAGIAARAVSGIEYLSGGGEAVAGFHAWAEVWLGRWVPVDATIPEVGTSARYLFLEMDEPGERSAGGDVAEFLTRKVRLEVVAWKHEGGERVEAAKADAKPAEKPAEAPALPGAR